MENKTKGDDSSGTTLSVSFNENELKDDYPVYYDYLYVCDDRVVRSDVRGTVRDLKADLRSYHKLEAKVITNCELRGVEELPQLP